MGTVFNTVTEILGSEPSPQLDERVYFELIRLRIAMRELAAAIDAKIAALSEQEQTAYQTDGLLEHKMFLSSLCTVKLQATETLSKYGSLCYLQPIGGGALSSAQLKATKAYERFADVVCVSDADAEGKYDLVLRGMYLNVSVTVQNKYYAEINWKTHWRLSTEKIRDPDNIWKSYDRRGSPTWFGPERKEQYGYYYVTGDWFIGHTVGALYDSTIKNNPTPSELSLQLYAKGAFVYFNPRRA